MSDLLQECDLLVVGGGINGTGIARDAAGQGLSVISARMDSPRWSACLRSYSFSTRPQKPLQGPRNLKSPARAPRLYDQTIS